MKESAEQLKKTIERQNQVIDLLLQKTAEQEQQLTRNDDLWDAILQCAEATADSAKGNPLINHLPPNLVTDDEKKFMPFVKKLYSHFMAAQASAQIAKGRNAAKYASAKNAERSRTIGDGFTDLMTGNLAAGHAMTDLMIGNLESGHGIANLMTGNLAAGYASADLVIGNLESGHGIADLMIGNLESGHGIADLMTGNSGKRHTNVKSADGNSKTAYASAIFMDGYNNAPDANAEKAEANGKTVHSITGSAGSGAGNKPGDVQNTVGICALQVQENPEAKAPGNAQDAVVPFAVPCTNGHNGIDENKKRRVNTFFLQHLISRVIVRSNNLGLTTAACILEKLEDSPKQSMKDLQRATGLTKSGMGKRLMSLKRKGLIERAPHRQLLLTDKAKSMLEQARR